MNPGPSWPAVQRARPDRQLKCRLTAPVAAVEFDAHADGPAVVAVRDEADLGRPDRRLQVVLPLQVRVRVAREDLPENDVRLF